jgi:hypothetical protein
MLEEWPLPQRLQLAGCARAELIDIGLQCCRKTNLRARGDKNSGA